MAKKRKWSVPEENFIIKQYLKEPQPSNTTVKRAFRLKFYPKNPTKLVKTRPADFRRVYDRFLKNGTHRHHQASDMPKRKKNPAVAESVEAFIEEQPTSTLRAAAQEIKVPKSTVII